MPRPLSFPIHQKILFLLFFSLNTCFFPKAAVDYNGTPLTPRGSITITSTTSSAVLNSYLQQSNNAGLPNNRFGSLGTVTTNISPQTPITSATVYSILLQPDGKIITVSSDTMVRYNTDGTLDSSFGAGGIASISATIISPNRALLLNSGQILLVAGGGASIINVYSTTGTLQTTLTNPVVAGYTQTIFRAIAVQSNGYIIAGGVIFKDADHRFYPYIVRWKQDFTLDTTGFNNPDGYVIGIVADSIGIKAIAVNAMNTIYAAGGLVGSAPGPNTYTSAGVGPTPFTHTESSQPAISFDSQGNIIGAKFSTIQFSSWADPTAPEHLSTLVLGKSQALLLQPTANNAILVIGNDGANNLKIARFIGVGTPGASTYGQLDTTFAQGGILTGIPMTSYAGAVQPDGKILVGGNFKGGPFDGKVCVIRLNPNGTIDPTFQTPNFLGDAGQALTATLQSNGTFITAGTDGIQTCFASYNANGSTNFLFGSGLFKSLSGVVTASLLQPDGCLVTASCCGQFCVARYTTTGTLDTTFGSGTGFVSGPVGTFSPYALLLQPNGYLVALGTTLLTGGNFCLVRYSSTGIFDSTFGTNGLVTGPGGTAYGGILQSNGQIIAAGNDGAGNIYATRYNSDGTPDTSFNGTGSLTGRAGTFYASLSQSNGSLIFVGTTGTNMLVARTDTNGFPDASFGTNGFTSEPAGVAYTALLQSDGKIVTLGTTATTNGNLCLARFNSNGSLDTTFGPAGTGIITGGLGTFYAALLQENNQILGIGQSGNTGVANFFISNYINPFTLASFTASYGSVGLI
jgi:uncharacterized delta-60 repeat protein